LYVILKKGLRAYRKILTAIMHVTSTEHTLPLLIKSLEQCATATTFISEIIMTWAISSEYV